MRIPLGGFLKRENGWLRGPLRHLPLAGAAPKTSRRNEVYTMTDDDFEDLLRRVDEIGAEAAGVVMRVSALRRRLLKIRYGGNENGNTN